MKPALPIAVFSAALLAAPAALGQEVIRTGPEGAPPAAEAPPSVPADDDHSAAGNAAWANRVLAGAPAEPAAGDPPKPGCAAPPDRKPHGEVWAGVGTGGYRELGAVVTQPLGACGSVTVAVDKTEGSLGRRRR